MTGNPLRVASELAIAGKTHEAIACLESALAGTRSDEERPADTSHLAKVAGLHCDFVGQVSRAALYYEEAVATADEFDPLLFLALADVCWRLGQADRARSCLAAAEASDDAEVKTMIANIRARWASDSK